MASVTTSARPRFALSLFRDILFTGMAISVVGGVEFIVFFYLAEHITPVMEYQYIASGLMGPSAFADGYMSALIGVLVHFAISFVVAAVFLVAVAFIRPLRRVAWLAALVYGIAVNLVMGMVVLPHSLAPKGVLTLPLLLNGIIGDAIFIGVPLAVAVWLNMHTVKITAKAWPGEASGVAGA